MRLVMGIDTNEVLLNPGTYVEVRALKEQLIENLILSLDSNQEKIIIDYLKSSIKNSQWLSIIGEAFTKTPKTKLTTCPPIDLLVSQNNENLNVIDLLFGNQVESIIKKRKKPIQSRENREDFFKRVFYPFASTANCLHLFDPYLVTNLFKNKPGVFFLIDQHLKGGLKNFVIYSSTKSLNVTRGDIEKKIKDSFSRINPFGEIKIRLEIVRPPAERPHIDHLHGRHARYSYASTQISPVIEMEKGTESFNSELMNASHSIRADITDSTALLREKNLTTSELPKYQIKIP